MRVFHQSFVDLGQRFCNQTERDVNAFNIWILCPREKTNQSRRLASCDGRLIAGGHHELGIREQKRHPLSLFGVVFQQVPLNHPVKVFQRIVGRSRPLSRAANVFGQCRHHVAMSVCVRPSLSLNASAHVVRRYHIPRSKNLFRKKVGQSAEPIHRFAILVLGFAVNQIVDVSVNHKQTSVCRKI